jgi:hypothetical protein
VLNSPFLKVVATGPIAVVVTVVAVVVVVAVVKSASLWYGIL